MFRKLNSKLLMRERGPETFQVCTC